MYCIVLYCVVFYLSVVKRDNVGKIPHYKAVQKQNRTANIADNCDGNLALVDNSWHRLFKARLNQDNLSDCNDLPKCPLPSANQELTPPLLFTILASSFRYLPCPATPFPLSAYAPTS